jgi:hypothetical protein
LISSDCLSKALLGPSLSLGHCAMQATLKFQDGGALLELVAPILIKRLDLKSQPRIKTARLARAIALATSHL